MSTQNLIIVCLNNNLRLADNPALYQASSAGTALPVYILDDAAAGPWKMAAPQRWWLHQSLLSLQQRLAKTSTPLILRKGKTDEVLKALVAETHASAVYYNERFDLPMPSLDDIGVKSQGFNATLLTPPGEITPIKGGYFKVFTPFWRAYLKTTEPELPLGAPTLKPIHQKVHSELIADWNLQTDASFQTFWTPGEERAQSILAAFISEALLEYPVGRDLPAESLTSKLSPYLSFGEISVRQIWHAITSWQHHRSNPSKAFAAEHYLRELGWREFCYQLLHFFPQLPTEPFDSRFNAFEWAPNASYLQRWQKGLTGYPLVDAGMRQLAATGWMHNRVRMIVASFLTKDLMIPWQKGEEWFWQNLLDADLANNSANWQWVAGCGADAAPFFRIFNPILQSQKFDPQGHYIHQWVPELRRLPAPYCHEPWKASLGNDYPLPIVDHGSARKKALAAFANMR